MLHHDGRCLCSAVRYRVRGAPVSSLICHCGSCRRAGAAPSVAWLTYERGNFDLLSGALVTFASSPGVQRTFCGSCGTPLTYANERFPNHIDITTASLEDPTLFPPTQEVWTDERLPWEELNARLERHARGTNAATCAPPDASTDC